MPDAFIRRSRPERRIWARLDGIAPESALIVITARFRFEPLVMFLAGVLSAAQRSGGSAELIFHRAPKPLSADAVTEAWPHFLGPHHNATTRETRLLDRWPADGPRKVWEMETGEGYACPVIVPGRLVYFHRLDGKETVDCLDPETGRRLWRTDYPASYEDRYGFSPGPRASAVIDGGQVFTAGVTAVLQCLDLTTGSVLWRRDLAAEFKVPQYFFGYGPAPFIWQDRVIVTVGGKGGEDGTRGTCVAAFDRRTGNTLWEVEDSWGADYASPLVATIQGKPVALVLTGGESRPSQGGLLVIDVATGARLARFPWRARNYESATASTPLVLADGRVLVSECYEKGGTLLEFDPALQPTQAWVQRGFGLHFMTPLEMGGHLYGFAGRNPPDTELKAIDLATGKIIWTDDTRFTEGGRVQSFFRGTLLRAGERVFCLGEDGLFAELELSPKGVNVRQRTRLFQASSAWTLPALNRGLLYVAQNERDSRADKARRIICYDFRGE